MAHTTAETLTTHVRAAHRVLGGLYKLETNVEGTSLTRGTNPVQSTHRRKSAMAPNDTNSFNHRKEQLASGRSYHFIDQEPKGYSADNCPTILCIHGFPDCWRVLSSYLPSRAYNLDVVVYRVAWKHQIQPWVETGYRVVVPDMLGYGETDKPEDPSEYSFKKLSNDLADILGAIGVGKAVSADRVRAAKAVDDNQIYCSS